MMKILIADDSPTSRAVLKDTLAPVAAAPRHWLSHATEGAKEKRETNCRVLLTHPAAVDIM